MVQQESSVEALAQIVILPGIGRLMEYEDLLTNPTMQEEWEKSTGNKYGQIENKV